MPREYLGIGPRAPLNQAILRAGMRSVAGTFIAQMQDYLETGGGGPDERAGHRPGATGAGGCCRGSSTRDWWSAWAAARSYTAVDRAQAQTNGGGAPLGDRLRCFSISGPAYPTRAPAKITASRPVRQMWRAFPFSRVLRAKRTKAQEQSGKADDRRVVGAIGAPGTRRAGPAPAGPGRQNRSRRQRCGQRTGRTPPGPPPPGAGKIERKRQCART